MPACVPFLLVAHTILLMAGVVGTIEFLMRSKPVLW